MLSIDITQLKKWSAKFKMPIFCKPSVRYDTQCPIIYALDIVGQKWKLPIM